jgi:uncharacterized protein YqjF (DUF2071 family)
VISERLRRHPIPVSAHFRHSLVLTYAFPRDVLAPLVPRACRLDTYGDHAFAACALVQTESLRPTFVPRILGRRFFLSGYRIFVRLASAPSLRGLLVLRSDTDSRIMCVLGNLFTHYGYRLAQVELSETDKRLEVIVRSEDGRADARVAATLEPAGVPTGSPFDDLRAARPFAGPLPHTFAVDAAAGRTLVVRARRSGWAPQSVRIDLAAIDFFEQPPFGGRGVLATAFHVADVDYGWERGRLV